jgi:ATP-binding cassette subfamily B protein RaxB
MVFAYLAYKTQFIQKASSLVDQMFLYRLLSLHLERLADIALTDQDVSFEHQAPVFRELQGRIELRDVSFSYAPNEPPVLEGINLVIEAGAHVAITGPSGGGKSTLAKVLLGLAEPSKGTVLVDGQALVKFGYKHYHEQLGAVLQDDSLFAGTLANNIALFDDAPEFHRIVEATRAAALLEDIEAMPMGFDTLVGDMGSTLSGGQRQRLLLARALYRSPRLLLIDEGTSHLDVAREQAVNAAVAQLGITRVVIAHRLETIVEADKVYAMDRGRLEEVTAKFAPIKEQLRANAVKS